MKKTTKIGIGIGITITLATAFWLYVSHRYYDGDSQAEQAKVELQTILTVIKKLMWEDVLTPQAWKKINSMEDLAPLVAPQIEGANKRLLDPWGNQYLLEKREENGRLIITISSSHEPKVMWYERKKQRQSIELSVSMAEQRGTDQKRTE